MFTLYLAGKDPSYELEPIKKEMCELGESGLTLQHFAEGQEAADHGTTGVVGFHKSDIRWYQVVSGG